MSTILVTGAGGFIGSHLAEKLRQNGHYVIGVDIKLPEYKDKGFITNEFHLIDLRWDDEILKLKNIIQSKGLQIDYIYNLAADMGGMGYVTGRDGQIMQNSGRISLNMIELAKELGVKGYLITSSACRYPEEIQMEGSIKLKEEDAYPSNPQDGYGWEKIWAERLCHFYRTNYGLNTKISVFHNIYGERGTWEGGKEKAPAALCRKVAKAKDGDEIEVWGDGTQLRSFCHVDDAVIGLITLMNSDIEGAVNIGSDEEISIKDFTQMIIDISGKNLRIKYVDGAIGVNSRNSDNTKAETELGFVPKVGLREGMERTYKWINEQVNGRDELNEETIIYVKQVNGTIDYYQERVWKAKGFLFAESNNGYTIYKHQSKFDKYKTYGTK